jgi:hypothetical protein
MPIKEEEENIATPFEIEIYAEMHNLINYSDHTKVQNALNMILVKLLSVVYSINANVSKQFMDEKSRYMKANIRFEPTTVLDKKGWNIKDSDAGIELPATPEIMDMQIRLFEQLQARKINSNLTNLMIRILAWLIENKIFRYNALREGDLYSSLVNGGNGERGEY